METVLLTTLQLAKRLGIAAITLQIWRSQGIGIPFVKQGTPGTVQAANDSPVGSLSRATGLSRVRPGLAGSDAVGCNGQPDRRVASEFGRGAQNAATLAPLVA